jgi:hypothetical protein
MWGLPSFVPQLMGSSPYRLQPPHPGCGPTSPAHQNQGAAGAIRHVVCSAQAVADKITACWPRLTLRPPQLGQEHLVVQKLNLAPGEQGQGLGKDRAAAAETAWGKSCDSPSRALFIALT